MNKNNSQFTNTISRLLKNTTAKELMCSAFEELCPDGKNYLGAIISCILGLIFALIIGLSDNTVSLSINIFGIIFNAFLVLFGFVFTVLAIIISLLGDKTTKVLTQVQNNNLTYLETYINYLSSALWLYFFGLSLSGICLLAVNCLDPNFILTNNYIFNESLTILLLLIYFVFVFRLFYELKSVLYNFIMLLRVSLAVTLYNTSKNEEKVEEN